jgi:serine phosphatase RsbU (regulator of sigma subunit)
MAAGGGRIGRRFLLRVPVAESFRAIPGFDIAGASDPAELVAGDHFDYLPTASGTLGIVIGDVAGHGFGPTLLMASLRAHLRGLVERFDRLDEVLTHANRLLSDEMDDDYFVTLLLGRFDPRTGIFEYVNAGHPSGCVLDRGVRVKSLLESDSYPLGVDRSTTYPSASHIRLESGDTLLLLTDGILEAQSPSGIFFGRTRTLEIARQSQRVTALGMIQRLHAAVRVFVGPGGLPDDITSVVVRAL